MGHADEVEIIVINDNTARTSALQAGQVHMMNRVDPKIVELLKGAPGISIEAVAGPWSLRLYHALRQGPV